MMDSRMLVEYWFHKAQLDYRQMYLELYISYNAWYRQVTHSNFDRESIARLKRRVRIWMQYRNNETLQNLRPVAAHIAMLTRQKPVGTMRSKWVGIVADAYDYENLIEFWYQIRCTLFHGEQYDDDRFEEFVKLAYLSLNAFMTEIMHRMNRCINPSEVMLLTEIEQLDTQHESSEIDRIRRDLRAKFIEWPDIWNVDV